MTKRAEAAAKRREQILEAAVTCFLEAGYHQTGVRDITERAGISLGNLYNHFPGKHDILVEIAARERADFEPFLELLSQPAEPMELVRRFATEYGTYLAAPENVILAIEITSEAIRKPDIGQLFVDNRSVLLKGLAAVLARGIQDGSMRPTLDPVEAAELVVESLEGSAYRSVLGELPPGKVIPGVRDFILAALRAAPEDPAESLTPAPREDSM